MRLEATYFATVLVHTKCSSLSQTRKILLDYFLSDWRRSFAQQKSCYQREVLSVFHWSSLVVLYKQTSYQMAKL